MHALRGLNLTGFHWLFILASVVLMELLGGYAIHAWYQTHDGFTLGAGILSLAAGLALVGYLLWWSRRDERLTTM